MFTSVMTLILGKEEVTSSILVNSSKEGSLKVTPFFVYGRLHNS